MAVTQALVAGHEAFCWHAWSPPGADALNQFLMANRDPLQPEQACQQVDLAEATKTVGTSRLWSYLSTPLSLQTCVASCQRQMLKL